MQISRECTPSDLSTGISNLLQPAQAEVVLGQLSTYVASWVLPPRRVTTEPEFRDVTRRLKRYLFRGQAAQQGFLLFSFRVVGKIYLVHFHKTIIIKIALSHSLNCFYISKYFKHIKLFSFYEKGSSNVTIIPS